MPVINLDYKDLINIIGKEIDREEFLEKFPLMGCEIERVDGDRISLEIFPNRPDMNSVEGIARSARSFFGIENGMRIYSIKKSDVEVFVEKSVKDVRPVIVTSVIKNVTMSDELISSIMDLQEKLHLGIGRNRKKIAIGVHDFDKIKSPFTYKAVDPKSIRFVPLDSSEEMDLLEILEKHPKGVKYAHLLKGKKRFPILMDSEDNVLSFPPIINGTLTEVTTFTKNIFVDVTGVDKETAEIALNIISTALAERGGEIHSTKVIDAGVERFYPSLEPVERRLNRDYVNKILGTNMDVDTIVESLLRMGYDAEVEGEGIIVKVPAWRGDILHEIDLVEDVAIGYGFDNITPSNPRYLTYGRPLNKRKLIKNIRTIMVGLTFYEVATLTLSNERDEFDKIGMKRENIIRIENPISEEYTCLRRSLLPSLLKICRANRHRSLPQRIFEIGKVTDPNGTNETHLSFVELDENTNFSRCKSLVEAIIRDSGLDIKIKRYSHPAFIDGRCAGIFYKDKSIGYFGEVHPKTLLEFEISHPAIAMEMDLEKLE